MDFGEHESDPKKLLKIYEIYREWLKAMSLNGVNVLRAPRNMKVTGVIDAIDKGLSAVEYVKKTYDIEELDEKAAANKDLWPTIIYGPVTLASDQYHKVLVILDPDDPNKEEKQRYVSRRFYNLIKWSWERHDPILDLDWITEYLEPLAQELENEGLTRIL